MWQRKKTWAKAPSLRMSRLAFMGLRDRGSNAKRPRTQTDMGGGWKLAPCWGVCSVLGCLLRAREFAPCEGVCSVRGSLLRAIFPFHIGSTWVGYGMGKLGIIDVWKDTQFDLGCIAPLYERTEGSVKLFADYQAFFNRKKDVRTLDPIGILEVLAKGHLLADRTLFSGLSRTPWLGTLVEGEWRIELPEEHGKTEKSALEIAVGLKRLLSIELHNGVKGRGQIGICLSGGLDSRIAAGVLRILQVGGKISDKIVGVTWGQFESRDVQYAKRIAESFGWDWRHLAIDKEVLQANFSTIADHGCECSPVHLHAMPHIAQMDDLDVIVCASYGDSVGRGEFAGKHLLDLDPILNHRKLNRFGFLKKSFVDQFRDSVLEDAYGYRDAISRKQDYQFFEIEQQMHYMRRQLLGCFQVIASSIPVVQIFTDPQLYGFMWDISPKLRTNSVYKELIKLLPEELHSVPWARDGRNFLSQSGDPDRFEKEHHDYGNWLRRDLSGFIMERVLSAEISRLGIFNSHALEATLKVWRNGRTRTVSTLDGIVSWIASLAIMAERQNVRLLENFKSTPSDLVIGAAGTTYSAFFVAARNLMRG